MLFRSQGVKSKPTYFPSMETHIDLLSFHFFQQWFAPLHTFAQAGITNCGPDAQTTLVRIPIILGLIDLDLQGQI